MKTIAVDAESKGGRIRAETMPILGRIVTPIHALATFIPPAVYIGALVLNKFRQPEWMAQFALSDEVAGVRLDPAWKGALRAGAVVSGLGSFRQAHTHGSVTRYTLLLQEVLWSVMSWSYIPLVALGITAAAFAVKMSIEVRFTFPTRFTYIDRRKIQEDVIQRDQGIKEDYEAYKMRVPARIIPYIW
ncbi:hypothetical protein J3R82DRAFT_11213 [Butyriboletus roseoflavus]|nr:hypothetical protein J3R82DRAFT_11213 [Butyriboletus roseoflavus]